MKTLVGLLVAWLVAVFAVSGFAQEAWEAKAYGEDWKQEEEVLKSKIPAIGRNEAIPSTPADEEFLLAVGRVIGSLAVRGDREAVEALKGIEADATEPAEVRQAAARALAHLNSDR